MSINALSKEFSVVSGILSKFELIGPWKVTRPVYSFMASSNVVKSLNPENIFGFFLIRS